jgi:hypothetical protein
MPALAVYAVVDCLHQRLKKDRLGKFIAITSPVFGVLLNQTINISA